MSRHRPPRPWRLKVWTAFSTVVLVGLSAWILVVTTPSVRRLPPYNPGAIGSRAPVTTDVPTPSQQPHEVVTTRSEVWFGISAPQVPWSRREIDDIAQQAGYRPGLLQYFVKWSEQFRPESITASYQLGAVPVISWEPWAGLSAGEDQPAYALAKITRGDFDGYIRKFAAALRDQGRPVVLRFAHEMNGTWYPWSESRSGNRPGDYVPAWRHVHDIFTAVGASNVIWVWSPNIIRPVPHVRLKTLYPGESYVDWVGMVGYAGTEATAAAVFDPTLQRLSRFTTLPVLITETAAPNGPRKVSWISDFFQWLLERPQVIGFVWFQYDKGQTGRFDWRFSVTAETTSAFRAGLSSLRLAYPPLLERSG